MTHRVVVTDHAFRDVQAERRVAREVGATFACHACTGEEETAEAVAGSDVAFVNFAPITRPVLSQMKPQAVVIRYGVGFDNVDVIAARELGIRVANVPDYGVETVADHAAAALLMLARRIAQYDRAIRDRGWVTPSELGPIRGFRSTVVGLIGMGRTAQALAKRLQPFGFSLIAHDPYCGREKFEASGVESVSLEKLAERAHAISLHATSTASTEKMINAAFFDRLQPGSVLVNTARGSLVDETALLAAIVAGRVAAAVLDVTDPEPVPTDSPLRARPEILFSPHAAFYDEDSLQNLQHLAAEEARRALHGEPLRCPVA